MKTCNAKCNKRKIFLIVWYLLRSLKSNFEFEPGIWFWMLGMFIISLSYRYKYCSSVLKLSNYHFIFKFKSLFDFYIFMDMYSIVISIYKCISICKYCFSVLKLTNYNYVFKFKSLFDFYIFMHRYFILISIYKTVYRWQDLRKILLVTDPFKLLRFFFLGILFVS